MLDVATVHRPPSAVRRQWLDTIAIFLLLLAVYLLTASGHLYSPDEETMYYVTRGVATGTGVTLPERDVAPLLARRGIERRPVSPYGVLPSLLALPFYAVGGLLSGTSAAPIHDYLTRFGVSLLNAPVTALTGALLYVFVRRLGYGRGAGWLAALTFGMCTFAWPYARTFFSEPLAALLLLIAVERAQSFRSTGSRWVLVVSGLAAGLLLATRLAEAVALPLLAMYILWNKEQSAENKISSHVILSPHHLVTLSQWTLGLIPGMALVVGYNIVRFGTPLATGYGDESSAFTTPLLTGLYGLLLSPGKSLFLYAPPALLALPGAWLLWRQHRATTLLLGALVVEHSAFYALWHAWDGGGVWGPRLLLPTVPLLIVLAAPMFVVAVQRWQRVLVSVVLSLGFINALAGVLVNFSVYVNSDVPAEQRIYNISQSPLLIHWQILAERMTTRYGPQRCVLGDGFFPSDVQHALLPRYTGARAMITCQSDSPVLLQLGVNDYRPPAAAASHPTLQLDDVHAGLPAGRSSQIHVLLPPNATLTLSNSTWNPAQSGAGPRDAPVGTLLYSVAAMQVDGTRLPLVDAAIEPPPTSPRLRWGWYFVPYNHHLIDLWPWYLARSDLLARQQWLVTAAMVGTSLLALAGSAYLAFMRHEPSSAETKK